MKPDFSKIKITYPRPSHPTPVVPDEVAGLSPYTRGIYPSMYLHQPMEIWYELENSAPGEINGSIKDLVKEGAAFIQFNKDMDPANTETWKTILHNIPVHHIHWGFYSMADMSRFFEYCSNEKIDTSELKGRIVLDSEDNEWIQNIAHLSKEFNAFQTLLCTQSITRIPEIAGKCIQSGIIHAGIRLTGNRSYLHTVAEMRAARKTWTSILVSGGKNEADAKLTLDCELETSSENVLVRSTLRALTAWMGGAQSITIPLTSGWQNEAYMNIARIIEEETYLIYATDPLGGAFNPESKTEELVAVALK